MNAKAKQQSEEEIEQPDEIDLSIVATKKFLRKHPSTNVEDFFNNYMVPFFEMVKARFMEVEEDVEELMESTDLPEESFVDEAENIVKVLATFNGAVLAHFKAQNADGTFTDAFPKALHPEFVVIAKKIAAFFERCEDARAAYFAAQVDDAPNLDDDDGDDVTAPGLKALPATVTSAPAVADPAPEQVSATVSASDDSVKQTVTAEASHG